MKKCIIRQAEAHDEHAIRACVVAAYTQYIEAIGKKPAPMTADFATLIAKGIIHVACDDSDNVLGCITFYQEDDTVFLNNLAVFPNHTGQGIGKSLVQFCEESARASHAKKISLHANEKMTSNLTLYPHLGYHETERKEQDGFRRVFFEKVLRNG